MTLAEAIFFLSPRQQERVIKGRDPLAEGLEFGSIGVVGPGFVDEIGDLCNIGFLHPTGGDGRRAAGFHRAAGVEGAAVFVNGDASFVVGVGGVGVGTCS